MPFPDCQCSADPLKHNQFMSPLIRDKNPLFEGMNSDIRKSTTNCELFQNNGFRQCSLLTPKVPPGDLNK